MEYKIIFESGITETINVGGLVLNEVLDNVEVRNEDGEKIDNFYLNIEHISAIIPQ